MCAIVKQHVLHSLWGRWTYKSVCMCLCVPMDDLITKSSHEFQNSFTPDQLFGLLARAIKHIDVLEDIEDVVKTPYRNASKHGTKSCSIVFVCDWMLTTY
jgi:hypothetical protein